MASHVQRDQRTLSSLSRINLLHELQERGAKTITELSATVGLHHNTAREHLNQLVEAGFVEVETIPNVGRGRPRLLYRAARSPHDATRLARHAQAQQRTDLMRRLLPVTDVTDKDVPRTRQLDALDDHMEQCGFDAVIEPDNSRMTMHECPYSDLAKNNPQVCAVHFALVQDALGMDEGPLRATELHPFCAPGVCVVDLEDSDQQPA